MEEYSITREEREILEKMPQPLAVYRYAVEHVETLAISDGFCRLFGYSDRSEAFRDMNTDIYSFNHPDDVSRLSRAALRFARGEDGFDVVYRTKDRGGKGYRIIHASGEMVFSGPKERVAYVWYIDEGLYTEEGEDQENVLRRAMTNILHEDSLLRASQYDQLTGLPSMTYFFQLAEKGKDQILEKGGHVALMYFDLNGMKFYNSRHSFAEGDRLLQAFAGLLVNTFGIGSCCHVGADHFTAFADKEGIEETLKQFFADCEGLNNGDSLPVRVGIYSTDMEETSVSLACDRAKYACDTLKSIYESAYQYFTQDMRNDAMRRRYILSHIDQAIEEGWIHVYYQPIIRAVNGMVCDEEALARWIDPVMGFLSPDEFIPFLEDAGLIYKLDLCVVGQVLEKIRYLENAGIAVVPQSVNLSRSDFNSCDIVEEIRRRVDDAGVRHSLITIEITESTLGSNFEFMKSQINRFRDLGFGVWLDDFGSGYSSLNVLQDIDFDLVKFDMSFMKLLDEGDKGRTLFTEMMRIPIAMNIDTVCEGVETAEQMSELKEMGCSKMQGYYFTKPIPLDRVLHIYENGFHIGFEDPAETDYYEDISRVNLYDLSVAADEDDGALKKTFGTLPMGILELSDSSARFVRSNQAYRDFMMRFYGYDISDGDREFDDDSDFSGSLFMKKLRKSIKSDGISFFDEKMSDGSTTHSLIRRVSVDPVNGKMAVAVAVLSISDAEEGATYAGIARALAADYYNIYYVNLETDKFIEYSSPVGGDDLAMERHGENFFDAVRRDAISRIYEEDRNEFLKNFSKERIVSELDREGVYTARYRLIDTGEPVYAGMKITRMLPDKNRIIIGISIIDSQMKQQEIADRLHMEETAYTRVMALSGDYLSLYTVDPETGSYYEFAGTEEYESLNLGKTGDDFFQKGIEDGRNVICPEDLPGYLKEFSRDNVLRAVRENGVFQIHYRLMLNGVSTPVSLKIVSVKERGTERFIAGVRAWSKRQ